MKESADEVSSAKRFSSAQVSKLEFSQKVWRDILVVGKEKNSVKIQMSPAREVVMTIEIRLNTKHIGCIKHLESKMKPKNSFL